MPAASGLAVAADAIHDAIRFYNTKTWKWNLVYQDITLVQSQYDYSLDQTVKEPRHVEVWDTSMRVVGRRP